MSSKWAVKQQRQLSTTTHLAQELLTNLQCSGGWFKKFCKGDKNLEDEEHSSQPLEVDNPIERIIKAVPLRTRGQADEELNVDHFFGHSAFETNWKVKKLRKWVPHELTKNQKNRCSEVSSSLILCYNNESLLNQIVTCNKKWILYNNQ